MYDVNKDRVQTLKKTLTGHEHGNEHEYVHVCVMSLSVSVFISCSKSSVYFAMLISKTFYSYFRIGNIYLSLLKLFRYCRHIQW
jgi:hypothetical protein